MANQLEKFILLLLLHLLNWQDECHVKALSMKWGGPRPNRGIKTFSSPSSNRRQALATWFSSAISVGSTLVGTTISSSSPSWAMDNAADAGTDGSLDVNDFLRSGMVSQPMGVSGQAGKSRPETGVILRDGSEVMRNSKNGDVLAEIVLDSCSDSSKMAALATYRSPWPLATGTVFDVECRDASTGDGVFLQVASPKRGSVSSIADVNDSDLLDALLAPTGRFSFYGPPTDVKIRSKGTSTDDKYRTLDLSFSTVSQATQTELPRRARLVATVPPGSSQVVMLIASSSAIRWKNKGTDKTIASVIDSFKAIPAPQGGMRVRGQDKRASSS